VRSDDDQQRFADVVMPHLGDAYALAHWLTGNAADAEDVVQEACIRAFRAVGQYAGGNARTWTLTIVRHTAFSWLAKNRRGTLVAVDDLEAVEREQALPGRDGAQISPATPEAELMTRVDAARLEEAIAALPPQFREALILREIQGLDYREIAQVTDVPVGTVMSRLARARRRLAAMIGANSP
jgi:RNA polymerase sigma-70 factor (ECF subfamily)